MRLGVIGIDSSHFPEFSRRINAMADDGRTSCRVVSAWTDGRHDWPVQSELEQWEQDARAVGVEIVDSLDGMLSNVDGVLILSVNGNRHHEFALPCLEQGLPTYIDKPLTCSKAEAEKLLETSRGFNARCYSASSLRFATELEQLDRKQLGEIVAVDAYGPGELHDLMPGLFHYGVHTIEMVDAILGPGVQRVSAIATEERHLLDLDYGDRYARLRLERSGAYDFGATVHGKDGVQQFRVDFAPVYTRLVEGMVRFFEGNDPPVNLDRIVENVAVMEAGNASIERSGAWVAIR